MGALKSHYFDEICSMEPDTIEPEDYQSELDNDPDYQTWLNEREQELKQRHIAEIGMNINQMKESKYVKKEDVGSGVLVTIHSVSQEDVSLETQPTEMKWILHFKEDIKPLVLNWTNIQLCASATGTEETDNWPGKKIVLYNDPNVSYQGKLIGGVRIRKPKQSAETASEPDFNDDVPF